MVWLQYQHATPFGEVDPLLGRDVAFYVFQLPFLDFVRNLLIGIVVLSLAGATAAYILSGAVGYEPEAGPKISRRARQHLSLLIAAFLLLLAWGASLDIPRTLLTPAGVIQGASYADVEAQIPMLHVLVAVALLGAGLDGVAREADPGEPNGDNLFALGLDEIAARGITALPPTLLHACDELVADDVLRAEFGTGRDGDYVDYFAAVKRAEFRAITDQVSAAEVDAYLTLV